MAWWGWVLAGVFAAGSIQRTPPTGNTRKEELGVESSALGQDLQKIHGRGNLKGKLVWIEQNTITELVKTTKYRPSLFSSHKSVKTFSYYGTFFVALGEAQPGSQIGRLWLDKKLLDNKGFSYTLLNDENVSGLGGLLVKLYNKLATKINNELGLGYVFLDGTQTVAHPKLVAEFGADAPAYTGTMGILFTEIPLEDYFNGIPEVKAEVLTVPSFEIEQVDSSTIDEPLGTTNFQIAPRTLEPEKSTILIPGWKNGYPANTTLRTANMYLDGVAYLNESANFEPQDSVYLPPSGLNDTHTLYREHAEFGHDGVDNIRYPLGMYQQRSGITIYAGTNSTAGEQRIYCRVSSVESYYMVGEGWAICLSSDGEFVYLLTETEIEKYTQDFTLVASIAHNQTPASTISYGTNFLWHDDNTIYYIRGSNASSVRAFKDDLSEFLYSGNLTSPSEVVYTTEVAIHGGILIKVYEESGGDFITFERYVLGNVFGELYDLDDAVEAICAEVGITIDTSDLSGKQYRGFVTGNESARSILEELQASYLFDIVPNGYGLKAVAQENKTSTGTLSWDDLAATTRSRPVVRVGTEWEENDRLPFKLEFTYTDPEIEYAENTQEAYFPTTSRYREDLSTRLIFLPDEAAQIAEKLIKTRHIERQTFEFSLPQTYLGLQVTDVKTLETAGKNYNVRITEITESIGQVLECKAVITEPSAYSSNAVGMSGNIPFELIGSRTDAETHLIDAPMIYDDQNKPGYLAAMWGQGLWVGGNLWRSKDQGSSYDSVQGFQDGAAIGYAFDTLGANDGYLIDNTNTLSIRAANGTFTTNNDIHAGEAICFYGADGRWEIMQYTTATVETDNTVTLSGFLRGRKGTEWATGTHQIDDLIILLDTDEVLFIGDTLGYIGIEQQFLGVTHGREDSVDEEDDIFFTYQGINLKPLSPVIGSVDTVSGDGTIDINFVPRSRFDNSGWWSTGAAVTTETTVAYEVDVLDGPGGTVLRTLTGTTIPIRYDGGDQVTDFGSVPSDIDLVAYQISPHVQVGRGYGYEFNSVPPEFDAALWAGTDTTNMSYNVIRTVATSGSGIGNGVAVMDTGQGTGKFVIEFVFTGSFANGFIGIYGDNRIVNLSANYGLTDTYGFRSDGAFRNGSGFSSSGSITWVASDIVTIMVDFVNSEITITRNNNEAQYTMSVSNFARDKYYPTWTNTVQTATCTVNSSLSDMTYAATLHPGIKELGNTV